MSINVKEKNDGEYVYSFSAEKQRESNTLRTLHAVVNDGKNPNANVELSNNRLAQNKSTVNTNSMQTNKNYSIPVLERAERTTENTEFTEQINELNGKLQQGEILQAEFIERVINTFDETTASKKSRCLDLVSFYITKNNKKAESKIQSPADKSAVQGVSLSTTNSIPNSSENVNDYSISTESASELLDRYESGEISRNELINKINSKKAENPVEIANMTEEDADTTPPLKRKQGESDGDVGRQWIALYAAKNETIQPILASSLKVVVDSVEMPAGYETGIHMFGSDAAFNLNSSLYDWNNNAPSVYVYFQTDNTAPSTAGANFTGGILALAGGTGILLGAAFTALAMKTKRKPDNE